MELLRFVALADPPRPIIIAVRIPLFPEPLWPRMKLMRGCKSSSKFPWHIKFFILIWSSFPAETTLPGCSSEPSSESDITRIRFLADAPTLALAACDRFGMMENGKLGKRKTRKTGLIRSTLEFKVQDVTISVSLEGSSSADNCWWKDHPVGKCNCRNTLCTFKYPSD